MVSPWGDDSSGRGSPLSQLSIMCVCVLVCVCVRCLCIWVLVPRDSESPPLALRFVHLTKHYRAPFCLFGILFTQDRTGPTPRPHAMPTRIFPEVAVGSLEGAEFEMIA